MKELSVFSKGHVRKYGKGQILLYQGEKSENTYFIKTGYIKVYDITNSGDEKILLILRPGDVFPVLSLYENTKPLHYFYEAYNDIEVVALPRKKINRAINKDHSLSKYLLYYFISVIQELMSRIECIEASGAKYKISMVLLYLARTHGKKQGIQRVYQIVPPVTHQVIANMAGVTRETASLQMKRLEKEKIVVPNSHHQLTVNCSRLEKLLNK